MNGIRDIRLRKLLYYWASRRRGRLMPRRADIDPVDIPWALPIIWLYDYVPERQTFRYRLAGEEINQASNQTLRGKLLEEVLPARDLPMVRGRLLRMVQERLAGHGFGRAYLDHGGDAIAERLVLPLSEDGETVNVLLGVSAYTWLNRPGAVAPTTQPLDIALYPVAEIDRYLNPNDAAAHGLGADGPAGERRVC